MKVDSLSRSRGTLVAVSAITLAASIFAFRAKADAWNERTVLTVGQTIQVRDTVLEPGQYVLKLYENQGYRHIIQIFNADQSHLINTVIAIPAQRMEPTGHTQFTFWETPPGTARALRTWYYPGDTIGSEFPYPKHLKEIAMVTTSSVAPAPAPAPVPEAVTTQPAQPEAPAVSEQEPVEQQQPVETAQNSPPPAVAPEPAPAAPPAELPKTGSLYPLIGLSGLGLLALSGLIKLSRSS